MLNESDCHQEKKQQLVIIWEKGNLYKCWQECKVVLVQTLCNSARNFWEEEGDRVGREEFGYIIPVYIYVKEL